MRQNHQLDLPYKNENNQYKDLLKQFQAEPDCPNRFCFCNGFYGSQKDEDQIFNLLKLCLLPDVEEDTELVLCDVSWNGLFAGKAFLRFQEYFPNIKLHIILPSPQDNIALQLIRDYQKLCNHADAAFYLYKSKNFTAFASLIALVCGSFYLMPNMDNGLATQIYQMARIYERKIHLLNHKYLEIKYGYKVQHHE